MTDVYVEWEAESIRVGSWRFFPRSCSGGSDQNFALEFCALISPFLVFFYVFCDPRSPIEGDHCFAFGRRVEAAGMETMSHSSTFLLPSLPPPSGNESSRTYALVVLNQRLPFFTPILWKHAQLRICADGGANRLHDEMPLMFPLEDPFIVRQRYKPDIISGDMDSIREGVKEFYGNMGTEIIDKSHDQDTTDLHKCILFICERTPEVDAANLTILVTGALGGRFDHEAGNINVLYRFPNKRIILLSDECLIYLLPKTHHHEILIQSSVEGPHCGLIPIGAPSANTTSTGLQWDLSGTEMHFGGLVSTSNLVHSEKIAICSDSDILWTISLRGPS